MVLTKNDTTIIASASNAAGATTRGTIDLSAVYGGIVTMKITNGATGPTLPCRMDIEISSDGTNSDGVYASASGVTGANASVSFSLVVGPEVI